MGDEHESEPFNDVIRGRLGDTRTPARCCSDHRTEPAEAGENDEEIEDR